MERKIFLIKITNKNILEQFQEVKDYLNLNSNNFSSTDANPDVHVPNPYLDDDKAKKKKNHKIINNY